MPLLFLLLFVAVATVTALANWRTGLLLCAVAGLLQDPVRKVTPGTPAYLTLAFLPIVLAMLVNLWSSAKVLEAFRRYHPQLLTAAGVFGVALLGSTAQTLSYGLHTLPLALLGLFSYGGGIPALFLGFFYLRRDFTELERPLMVLAGLTALMLLGVPLECAGYRFSAPWLGTVGMTGTWRRWYSETEWVEMISGFYRSPEVMGWHAALLVIICVYLMVCRPAWFPAWAALAAWGFSCVLLSGRRKMLVMVLAFLVTFALLATRPYRQRLVLCLLAAAVLIVPVLGLAVDDRYVATAQSSLPAAGTRLAGHAVSGPLWLVEVVGLFGYGVGTKTQGAQHLDLDIPAPLTEGGFEKVFVELGLVGTLTFLLFLLVTANCVFVCFQRARRVGLDQRGLAAMTAFVVANMAAFAVAFQIYGDPLVVFLVAFAGGLLLSGSRLTQRSGVRSQESEVSLFL